MRVDTALLAAALLLPTAASAQEAAPPPAQKPLKFRAIGFVDLDEAQDCPALEARAGRCVEEVRFENFDGLWARPAPPLRGSPAPTDDARQEAALRLARLRGISDLHAQVWEDLAFRWDRPGDGVEETLLEAAIEALPAPRDAWQAAFPRWDLSLAMPPAQAWLGADRWAAIPLPRGGAGGVDGLFRPLRTTAPEGVRPPPSVALLRGRTARRLGFGGRLYDFDLMDATPGSSGPFFEQVFPFRGAMESDDPRIRPLLHVSAPQELALLRDTDPRTFAQRERDGFGEALLESPGFLEFRRVAHREFQLFENAVGLQILRFGLAEHTVNQMRVLTALSAIQSPPVDDRSGQGVASRDLVAAALGETDRPEDIESRVDRGGRLVETGVRVHFDELPAPIVDEWLRELAPKRQLSDEALAALDDEVRNRFGELLRPAAPAVWSVEPHEVYQWALVALRPGLDPQPIVDEVRQAALGQLVAALPPDRRDEVESRLLLSHVKNEIAGRFDPTHGALAAPADVVDTATAQWQAVLLAHGYLSAPIEQGLGAVDPVSVCTTRDGREALREPSFGAVHLDLLVAGPAGEDKPGKILWEQRDTLPFLLVDDPLVEPRLEPLVNLSSGRTLYRIRWTIWTGWHLLWAPERLHRAEKDPAGGTWSAVPGDELRLAARTAAICSDMVLAAPELVPTLVRAALLDGELRPSVPVSEKDVRDAGGRRAAERQAMSNEEALGKAEETQGQAEEAGAAAGDAGAALQEGGAEAGADMLSKGLAGLGAESGGGIVYTEVSEKVRYLRDLVRDPLRRLARREKGLFFLTYDSTVVPNRPLDDTPPRTPYFRVRRAADLRQAAQTAAWGWWDAGLPESTPFALLSPGLQPTNDVATNAPRPRWRRGSVADGFLAFGTGMIPFHFVGFCGRVDDADRPVVREPAAAVTCGKDPVTGLPYAGALFGEGFAFDVQATLAIWGLHHPRVAVEFGPELRLDIGHGGSPWFYPETLPYERAWTFRPAAGFVVGLRTQHPAPDRAKRGSRAFPWGAPHPDGRTDLGRVQAGVRGGFLVTSGFNGAEGIATFEAWAGGSLRRSRGPNASFTPYRPNALLGPYIRAQAGFPLAPDAVTERYLRLVGSLSVIAGLRIQLRLAAPEPPEPPSAPSTPAVPEAS